MIVSRETEKRLSDYLAMLAEWNARINLVSESTLEDARRRHVEDSLQLIGLRTDSGRHWADLGAGGGVPGLVVAIASPWPETRFTMVESDQRKATFLRRAASTLGLDNVEVVAARIETVTPLAATTVSARALSPLSSLLSYVSRHLAPTGAALLMKGRSWRDEVAVAQQAWQFDLTAHPSRTDPEAAILEVSGLHAR